MLITTVGQGIQFLWLALSSRAELSAEVLFLRKQLAFYQNWPEMAIGQILLSAATADGSQRCNATIS
jgi:hypothetical protein